MFSIEKKNILPRTGITHMSITMQHFAASTNDIYFLGYYTFTVGHFALCDVGVG